MNFNLDGSKFSQNESLKYLIETLIMHSLIVFNIAQPGIFGFRKGVVVHKSKIIHEFRPVYQFNGYAYYTANELGWPKLNRLDFKIVWDWYWKNNVLGVSSTKLERALAAFSYLFVSDSFTMLHQVIFWSLIGLEALYCKGNSNLLGQLNEKSEVFLGKSEKNKSSFNKMYDYRSRYVHGDLNFTNKFIYDDLDDELSRHDTNVGNQFSIATALLIATFQKMAVENLYDLDFSYVLDKNDPHVN